MLQKSSLHKILAHKSAVADGNFVTPEYIITKNKSILNRYCPHRMYPLADVGTIIKENIICNFHGFEWKSNGEPVNNTKRIDCGNLETGKSGLLFKNFKEPDHTWVNDLSKETGLVFSHIRSGSSFGSWLWMMEIQADLLHIRKSKKSIHPLLAEQIDLDSIEMSNGENWILQSHNTGWWLFIYPFTFIEWSPGCLSINYTIPANINKELGFSWITQFYYDPLVSVEKRTSFETLEDVFREDVNAIEQQKSNHYPIITPYSRLEDHCVHFGKWIKNNKVKDI